MSNTGKFIDRSNFLKECGKTSTTSGESADLSLRQDLYFRSKTSTPDKIRKYRKSNREIPGVKQIHHGIYDDPKDYEGFIHGVKTKVSEHVPDCIKVPNAFGIKNFITNIHEEKYVRNIKEPLGKSIIRNYVFPSIINQDEFKFGIPSKKVIAAKEVIYSGTLNETNEINKLYQKTHGHTLPGEQLDRGYKWPVDKYNYVFGVPQNIEYDGCKKSLMSDRLGNEYMKTKIVDKHLEDFRQATVEPIGKRKCFGSLNQNLPEDFTYGVKSMKDSNWNAAMCMYGNSTTRSEKDLLPDSDLGKSFFHRSKLKTSLLVNSDRASGIPSIRNDLKKANPSVADIINYGNEKDAFELLYPNPHNYKGLQEHDFDNLISKEELKGILNKKGHDIHDTDFDKIFSVCLEKQPNNENRVTFRNYIETVRNLKREYSKYKIFFK